MPLDTAGLERLARTEDGLFKAIFSRMSEPERMAFGDEQIESLKNACGRLHWDKHPVDIRLSVPVLIARYYLVLLAGPERRNAIRRKDERARHHFWRWGNVVFAACCVLILLYVIVFAEVMLIRALFTDAAPE
jgi:hypothetical protein